MQNSSYLCSFHIPKTGGTTFAAHARKSLGDEGFLLHGPFSRTERFMRDLPQLEELTGSKREAIRIIHGHGAGLALAEAMTGRVPEFTVILRDPYARFVSGFHHLNSEKRNSGRKAISEEAYLQRRGGNFYATLFSTYFGKLAGGKGALNLENLMPILQSIKYFILTEDLDRQLQQISSRYGLNSGPIEARRVNKEKSELALDRKAFDSLNALDLQIYSIIAEAAAKSNSSFDNPFGYKPEPLQSYLEEAWAKQTPESRLSAAYDDLVAAGKETLTLQAIHLKLTNTKVDHVTDISLLVERTGAAVAGWLAGLGDEEASVAYFSSGLVFLKQKNFDTAEELFQESVRLNPKNDNALAHLARVLHRRGKKDDAVSHINRALALRPERPSTQAIYKLISERA